MPEARADDNAEFRPPSRPTVGPAVPSLPAARAAAPTAAQHETRPADGTSTAWASSGYLFILSPDGAEMVEASYLYAFFVVVFLLSFKYVFG